MRSITTCEEDYVFAIGMGGDDHHTEEGAGSDSELPARESLARHRTFRVRDRCHIRPGPSIPVRTITSRPNANEGNFL